MKFNASISYRAIFLAVGLLHLSASVAASDTVDLGIPETRTGATQLGELPAAPSTEQTAALLARGVPEADVLLDPADYYVGELAAKLGYEPLAAFEYVRDQIRLDPYTGLLRGPDGVLASAAGGALDRSMLLVALLEEMAVDARLVHGNLGPAERERLIAAALPTRGQTVSAQFMTASARERLAQRARRDYFWLVDALDGAELGSADSRLLPGDIGDHVWVQAELGDGWTNLDSAFPDAQPGDTFAEAKRITSTPADDAVHRVTFSIKAETLNNGVLNEVELLSHAMPAHSAQNNRIFFVFVSAGAGFGNTLGGKLSPDTLMSPALLIDDETIKGRPVPGIAVEMSEQQAFFFGGTSSTSTAVYLDVKIQTPGAEPTVRRRVIYDRVTARARFEGDIDAAELMEMQMMGPAPAALQGIHQILVSTGGLNPHAVLERTARALEDTLATLATDKDIPDATFAQSLAPLAAGRANWQLAAEEIHREAGLSDQLVRLITAEPQVVIMSILPQIVDNTAVFSHVTDLLHTPKQVIAAEGVAGESVAHHYLWHGALESALETTSSEFMGALSPSGNADVISASMATGEPPTRLRNVDEALNRKSVSYALLSEIESKQIVLVPANDDGMNVWWAVDPETGSTFARGDTGLGVTNLPVWVKNNLRYIAKSKATYANADQLNAYAKAAAERAKLNKQKAGKSAPKSSRSGTSSQEYAVTLEISFFHAHTSGQLLGYAIGFQMLTVITLWAYGVSMDRF